MSDTMYIICLSCISLSIVLFWLFSLPKSAGYPMLVKTHMSRTVEFYGASIRFEGLDCWIYKESVELKLDSVVVFGFLTADKHDELSDYLINNSRELMFRLTGKINER